MKKDWTYWIKSKLDSIEDKPTPGDWAAMEELINAQPELNAKPWYRNTGGFIGGLVVLISAIVLGSLYSTNQSDDDRLTPAQPSTIEQTPTPNENSTAASTISNTIAQDQSENLEQSTRSSSPEQTNAIKNSPTLSIQSEEASVSVASSDYSTENTSRMKAEHTGIQVADEVPASASADLPFSSPNRGDTETSEAAQSLSASTHAAPSVNPAIEESEADFDRANQEVLDESEESDNANEVSDLAMTHAAEEAQQEPESKTEEEIIKPIVSPRSSSANWSIGLGGLFGMESFVSPSSDAKILSMNPSYGGSLDWAFHGNGWRFRTGLNVMQNDGTYLQERLDQYQKLIYDTTITYQVNTYWQILGINQGQWVFDTIAQVNVDSNFVLFDTLYTSISNYSTTRIAMPLLVGKEFKWNRWNLSLEAGVILDYRRTRWSMEGGDVFTSNFGVDVSAGLELEYLLDDRWSVWARSSYRSNIIGQSDLSLESFKWTSIPIGIGVRYRF